MRPEQWDRNGYDVSYFQEETTSREWRTPDREPVSSSARTTFTLRVAATGEQPRPEGLAASDLRAIVAAMDATGAPDGAAVDAVQLGLDVYGVPTFKCARISWVTGGENR